MVEEDFVRQHYPEAFLEVRAGLERTYHLVWSGEGILISIDDTERAAWALAELIIRRANSGQT